MWTDKYAPKSLNDFIGNSEAIKLFTDWMKNWETGIKKGNKQKIEYRCGKQVMNLNFKACLISGPPGIGKSTLARLMAKEFGYEVLETNASDQRSKKVIEELLSNTVDNKSINFYRENPTNTPRLKKVAIIMDEIDGVSGSNDRGGIAALIKIIENSKMPVICICNDRQNSKIRSLAYHCLDIKFFKYL